MAKKPLAAFSYIGKLEKVRARILGKTTMSKSSLWFICMLATRGGQQNKPFSKKRIRIEPKCVTVGHADNATTGKLII